MAAREQATVQAPLANRKSPSYKWNPIYVNANVHPFSTINDYIIYVNANFHPFSTLNWLLDASAPHA